MQSIKIDRVQNQIYGLIVHRRAVTLFCFYLTEYQFSLCQRDSYVRYAISCKRIVLKNTPIWGGKNEKVIVKCNFKRYSIFSRPLLAAVPGSHTLPAAVRQKTCLVPFPPLALALPRVGPAWPSTLSQRIHSEPQRGTRNPTGNPLLSKTPNPYHPLVNIGHAW